MRTAIVTTLTNAEDVIDTFLDYHLKLGFDQIFLFFDNPNDELFEKLANTDSICLFKNDNILRERWEETKAFDQFHPFIAKEVMARQILNMEIAIQECLNKGIQWLLHIDIDELFYSPKQSIVEHFNAMEKKGIHNIQYLNHEAIPETIAIGDYFKEVSLFKRNAKTINYQNEIIEQNIIKSTGDKYFLFYGNGKSACRIKNGTYPKGIREFENGSEQTIIHDPSILHYPCCGITHFYKKYQTLKKFSDKWFGIDDIRSLIPTHIEARDIFTTNNAELIKKFYEDNFIRKPLMHYDEFLRKNIYFRVKI